MARANEALYANLDTIPDTELDEQTKRVKAQAEEKIRQLKDQQRQAYREAIQLKVRPNFQTKHNTNLYWESYCSTF